MQTADGRPIEVFYSYSHEDEEYRKKLGKHLSVLRRAGLITDWHDRDIDAGTAWQDEIDRHLLSADIVLLLVSASFIASDYCWGDEMTKALERHKEKKARVIPVILHPCGWLRTPLQALQGVPRDNKAISLWSNEHAAFDHVVTEIAKVVDDLRRSKTAEPELVEPASAVGVIASTPSPPHPAPLPPGEGGTRDSGRVRAKEEPVPKDGVYIGVDPRELPDLAVFKDIDAPWCPEMVVIPAGQFLMGSPRDEPERSKDEGPQHRVTIGYRFALGRYAVTFAEYDHFCEETNREKPAEEGWGRGRRPVINVNWRDAQAYVEWLAEATGKPYRLPSEAQWEYACRGGTTTRYAFGDAITPQNANYAESKFGKTTEVGANPPNPWGLYDMHGNVWEWVEDIWHDNYKDASTDGSAWINGGGDESSRYRVIRGGSWFNNPGDLRSAVRNGGDPGNRSSALGFRVARTLD